MDSEKNSDSSNHPTHQHYPKNPASNPFNELLQVQQDTLKELATIFQKFTPTEIQQTHETFLDNTKEIVPTIIPVKHQDAQLPRVNLPPEKNIQISEERLCDYY